MLSLLTIKTTTEEHIMMKFHPHPGSILREDVFGHLGIEVTKAAKDLNVSRTTLSRVLHEHAGISPDLAIRLEKAGIGTARSWMALQANYELSKALEKGSPNVTRIIEDNKFVLA